MQMCDVPGKALDIFFNLRRASSQARARSLLAQMLVALPLLKAASLSTTPSWGRDSNKSQESNNFKYVLNHTVILLLAIVA